MDMQQIELLPVGSQPAAEPGAESEIAHGRHRRSPAPEQQHRHPFDSRPLADRQIAEAAGAVVIGAENARIHPVCLRAAVISKAATLGPPRRGLIEGITCSTFTVAARTVAAR